MGTLWATKVPDIGSERKKASVPRAVVVCVDMQEDGADGCGTTSALCCCPEPLVHKLITPEGFLVSKKMKSVNNFLLDAKNGCLIFFWSLSPP